MGCWGSRGGGLSGDLRLRVQPPDAAGDAFTRVLEYGVRAPVFYGNLREQTAYEILRVSQISHRTRQHG